MKPNNKKPMDHSTDHSLVSADTSQLIYDI